MLRKRKQTTRAPAKGSGRLPRGVMLLWLSLFLAGISVMSGYGQVVGWASPTKYWIIYPEYLSRTELSGTEEIGILGIQIEVPAGLSSTISQVVLSPDAANTFDATLAANLADVHFYLSSKNANFPAGTEMTGTFTRTGGVITANFTGNNTITAGASSEIVKLQISFDIPDTVASGDLEYKITSITDQAGQLTGPPAPSSEPHAAMQIRDFDTTLAATDTRGTDDAEQETFLEIMRLTFGDAGDEHARRRVDGLTFTSLGDDDADVQSVILYRDNGNGTFLATEEDILGSGVWTPGAPSGGTAVFSALATTFPTTNTPYGDFPWSTSAIYWFVVEIASGATVGHDIRFEVTTPAGADIVFYDDVPEPVAGSDQTFTQVGYIGTPPTVQSNAHPVIAKQTVDTTPPTVIPTSLIPGVDAYNVARNTNFRITFNDVSGMDPASLNVTTPNFTLYNNTDSVFVDVSGWGSTVSPDRLVWTLDPDVDLDYSKSYRATVVGGAGGVQDNATTPNPMAADYFWDFITEEAPQVNYTFPGPSATGVSINPTITVAFTKPMNEATVENLANFDLDNGAGVTEISYNTTTRIMTVTLGAALLYETLYTATATTGMLDSNGNPLPSDYVWSFTTEAQPLVTATNPTDSAVGVPVNPTIAASFTKPMNQATVENLANFSLDNGAGVTGITYNPGTLTMTVTLGGPLLYETLYTAAITTGVIDANGNPLPAPKVWTFTTEARPAVVSTTPADTASGVSSSLAAVTVTFSKPMDTSTFVLGSFTLDNGATVTGVAPAGDQTMTVTLGAPLLYETFYTATVVSDELGSTGVTDADGNYMIGNHPFSFTTAPEYPDFDEPIAIDNVIRPGEVPAVKIFIQQPPNTKATDRVDIQVFTVTGKRVATLTGTSETYQQVLARLPIVWDGTNGRSERLGPGMYFIQIKSKGYKKVLKVMIVR